MSAQGYRGKRKLSIQKNRIVSSSNSWRFKRIALMGELFLNYLFIGARVSAGLSHSEVT